ncbi:MAG TPA: lipopolysaccharide biosynthesis protein, partial [Syntrophorhabdaceae bacterium]|nr:lipopolysaccharide biosynthesis protein [Syntrophorhabdaceae bacterium]
MTNPPEDPKTDLLNYVQRGTQQDYSSLTIHSFRGGIVTLTSQFAKFALQLGSVAILARILTPEDYGLFAIVIAVVVFGGFLNDMGLQMSTIQRELVTHEQVSNLFWVNAATGTALVLIAVAAAPLIGWFYHEPRLTAMLAVLSLVFIANALGSQQQAIMKRTMRFGTVAAIEAVSMASGVLVAIIAAFHGAGYWALVYMHITLTVLNAASVWFVSKWHPGLPDRSADIRPLLRYGRHLMGLGILGFACRNVDTLLIGWYLGAREVGLYDKAYQLLLIPLLQVEIPLAGFALSILSRARRNT